MKKMTEEQIKQVSVVVGFLLTVILIFYGIFSQMGFAIPEASWFVELQKVIFWPFYVPILFLLPYFEGDIAEIFMVFSIVLYFCLAFCLFFRITQAILRRKYGKRSGTSKK